MSASWLCEKHSWSCFSALFWAWNWKSSYKVWGCESTFCGSNRHVSMREGLFFPSCLTWTEVFTYILMLQNTEKIQCELADPDGKTDMTLNLKKGCSCVQSEGSLTNLHNHINFRKLKAFSSSHSDTFTLNTGLWVIASSHDKEYVNVNA